MGVIKMNQIHVSKRRINRTAPVTSVNRSRELARFGQLVVCLLIFFAVLLGKGVFPDRIIKLQENIRTFVTSDVDYYDAFSKLGMSISEYDHTLKNLENFCIDVFGGTEIPAAEPQLQVPLPNFQSSLTQEISFLCQSQPTELLAHYWQCDTEADAVQPAPETTEKTESKSEPQQEQPDAVATAGTLLLTSEYNGRALPANYTMDMLSLGDLETVTPVLGHLNSEYGYRDHPINGAYQFHGGVDIGGQTGDPISAFAAGTVEYIGENNSYGLYLQLDHGNGVKSFYAHCSKIIVKKGQEVAVGEKIAEVGSSGAATGPHLHLELKFENTHLNPAYYVQFTSTE